MFLTAPLEQFEVYDIMPIFSYLVLWLFGCYITNSTLFIGVTCFLLFIALSSIFINSQLIPVRWQLFIEYIYDFVDNLVKENVGIKYANKIVYIIWFLFVFILTLNLVGMVPYSFTVTSHFIITFSLSLSLFIGLNIVGILKHGHHILKLFLPEGSPTLLIPLLFIIEVISYISRVFSLSIRLFANLMSGHTLLKILSGFAWAMFLSGGFITISSFFPIIVIFLVTGLEVAIGALQAYVFCMLLCLYYNDVIHLH